MKILFIGDIVGQIGRRAILQALPKLRKKYSPDFVIANVENLAHGRGVTVKTLNEIKPLDIDVYTGGNHIFTKELQGSGFDQKAWNLVTPANDPRTKPDGGFIIVAKNKKKILVINLRGTVFFQDVDVRSPFSELEKILDSVAVKKFDAVIVDMHAEATSEKVALGFFADGQVTAVLGTHTHIPTADERILPKGTAYVTDVGMCGPIDSVLGVKKEVIIDRFTNEGKMVFDYPESGEVRVGAMLIETEKGLAKSIKRVDINVTV